MEREHDENYYDNIKTIKEYGFIDEFVIAVKEEEQAIQKIIEAYDKRLEDVKPLDITDMFLRLVMRDKL